MSQLVTGDAVVLGLHPARVPTRALAVALDLVVYVGAYLLLATVLLSTVLSLGTATAAAVQVALLVLLLVGAPVAVETLSHGRSLGKLACGLRVVRDDGGPIRFRHALVRGAIGFIELLATAGTVACVASLVSAQGRRLGDVFAGTLVVRERIPGGRAAPPPPPPEWVAGQFAQLDLSRVPEGLWLAVRQYLTRMRQLDPQVAWSMAVKLCGDLVDRIGTPAPPGIHPVAYLAGVAAERQRREARRAFGVWEGQQGQAAGGAMAGWGPPGVQPVTQPPPAPAAPAAPAEPPRLTKPGGRPTGFTPPS